MSYTGEDEPSSCYCVEPRIYWGSRAGWRWSWSSWYLASCQWRRSIVTVPASEDENVAEDVVEDSDEDEDMQDVLEKMKKLDTEVKELWKEIMDLLSSIPEDTSSLQSADVPQVEVWDTGKAWEQEYRLHPDPI